MRVTAVVITLSALAGPALGQSVTNLPAQRFTFDPAHTSVTFSVDHLGLSHYTAGFDTVTGTLDLDPADPAAAALDVTIPVASLDLPSPPDGFRDMLLGPDWFDAATYPDITFRGTAIALTGDTTADVEGLLTLHGQEHPVTLHATFNGNSEAGMFEPWARIGFSATAEVARAAFDMGAGISAPGSTLGVGGVVTVRIEAELTGETPG